MHSNEFTPFACNNRFSSQMIGNKRLNDVDCYSGDSAISDMSGESGQSEVNKTKIAKSVAGASGGSNGLTETILAPPQVRLHDSLMSPTSQYYKKTEYRLPSTINKIGQHLKINDFDIIIDIRPYNNYSNSHIKNSINICIPSTLLKRKSLDLFNILNLVKVPNHYKTMLLERLEQKDNIRKMNILFYDNSSEESSISLNLYQTVMKFNQFQGLNLNYLEGGFQRYLEVNAREKEYHSDRSLSISSSPTVSTSFSDKSSSDFIEDFIEYPKSPTSPKTDKCFSGFKLPSSTNYKTKFINSIKKNSIFDNDSEALTPSYKLNQYNYKFKFPDIKIKELPAWLGFLSEPNDIIIKTMLKNFNKIEKLEKLRLDSLVSNRENGEHKLDKAHPHGHPNDPLNKQSLIPHQNLCSPSGLCPSCDSINYKIPKGIEYGFKNRYNNIWPYEHSRVKLENPDDDYFNANFIDCKQIISTNFSYIATQNPLKDTINDFWQIIKKENIKIIVSLDNSPLNYLKSTKNVSSIETLSSTASTVIRKINNDTYHFEFKTWPDFGVPQDFDTILNLIEFKNNIFYHTIKNLDYNKILVHCSAGCGRTGVFITIDSLIDHFKTKRQHFLSSKRDLIYKLVLHQRTQRISMVQNLDQYIVCYEILLHYLGKVESKLLFDVKYHKVPEIAEIKTAEIKTADINIGNDRITNDDYFAGFQKSGFEVKSS